MQTEMWKLLFNRVSHSLVKQSSDVTLCDIAERGRYFCSTFDFKDIVKKNRVSSKSTSKKVKPSKSSASVPTAKTIPSPESEDSTSLKTQTFNIESCNEPEYFSVLLDCPLYAEGTLDKDKHSQFKDCIEDLDIGYLPSVSTIIKKTEPKSQQEVLRRWKEAKIKELGGEEQFDAYQKETLETGLSFHKCVELSLKGERDVVVEARGEGYWESVQHVLGQVTDVKLLEVDTVHSEMFYAGKFDCIAQIKNRLCIIEWKTSSKPKPLLSGTYDAPLQLAAYMGAVNRSGILKAHGIDNLRRGALVFAYPTGEPATVHLMNPKVCEKYWKRWQDRLYKYWTMRYIERNTGDVGRTGSIDTGP